MSRYNHIEHVSYPPPPAMRDLSLTLFFRFQSVIVLAKLIPGKVTFKTQRQTKSKFSYVLLTFADIELLCRITRNFHVLRSS